MTLSGGGAGGQVDTAYIDIEARIDGAERSLRQLESQVNQAGQNAGNKFSAGIAMGAKVAGGALLAVGGAAVAGAAKAVSAFADFESTMSGAAAVLSATSAETEKLSALALKMGAETSFGAGDAAKAIEELGSAGLNTASILDGGLKGALDLAAATGMKDVAQAAEIAAGTMNAFGLAGKDMATVADTVANAANVSALGVNDFGYAVAAGGSSAKAAGLSLNEFTASVSFMADKMIKGSDAGTSMKSFLAGLTPASDPAAGALEDLGIKAFDAAGNMRPFPEILAQMAKGAKNLTQEQRLMAAETAFGSDGIRAYNILVEQGAEGLNKRTKALETQGAAAAASAKRLDNLKGDVEQFNGSIETAMIKIGQSLAKNLDLRKIVQAGTEAVNTIGPMIEKILPRVLNGLTGFAGDAQKVFTQLAPMFKTAVDTILPVAVQVFGAIKNFVTDAFTTLGPVVKSAIETIAPVIKAVFAEIGPIVKTLAPLFSAAFTVVAQLWHTVLQPAIRDIAKVVVPVFQTVAAAVRGSIAIVTGVLKAVAALMRGDIGGAAREMAGAFKAGVDAAVQVVRGMGNTLLAIIKAIAPQFATAAKNIIDGFVNGIKAGPARIAKATADLGAAAVSGVTKFLKIKSPSRVMHELGEFTSQGFVNGIDSGKRKVEMAAREQARAFNKAFSDLKLEYKAGDVSTTAYLKVLRESEAAIRAKMKATREGSDAYSAYLAALNRVTSAIDAVNKKTASQAAEAKKVVTTTQAKAKAAEEEGKKTETAGNKKAEAAKREAEAERKRAEAKQAKARATIDEAKAEDNLEKSLNKATTAQLKSALARADKANDATKYKAVMAELAEREEANRSATEKSTQARKDAARELADNRAQIAASKANDALTVTLRAATSAQLKKALAVAEAKGQVDKYNRVKDEMTRREDVATAASDKATDAAKRAREEAKNAAEAQAKQLADNQRSINAGLNFEKYATGLQALNDKQLALAKSAAFAAGDQQRFNAVLAEQKTRAEEAADAISFLVDEQIKAANSKYADTQTATDSAFRKTYGAGDQGLITALVKLTGKTVKQVRADVEGAMVDLLKFNSQAAGILERVYADDLKHRRDHAAKAIEWGKAEEVASTERAKAIADSYNAQQDAADDASITVLTLTRQARELLAQGRDPKSSGFVEYLTALTEGSGQAAQAAQIVLKTLDLIIKNAPKAEVPSLARGTVTSTPLTETGARGALSPEAAAWKASQEQANYAETAAEAYRQTLLALTDAQLKDAQATALNTGNKERYAVVTALLETRAKTAVEATTAAKKALDDARAAVNGPTDPWQAHLDALAKVVADTPAARAELDKLTAAIKALQKQAKETEGMEKLNAGIGALATGLSGLANSLGANSFGTIIKGFGDAAQGALNMVKAVNDAKAAFKTFKGAQTAGNLGSLLGAFGAVAGVAGQVIGAVVAIGDAIEGLSPGLNAWKKGLTEVAALERDMAGQKRYGNINNPYFDALNKDADAREKMAGSKWYQRLAWSIFGGAPKYMDDAAAKFMAASSKTFGEVAETIAGSLDSALMNAFESGDWTGTEDALAKSLDTLVARMALQAITAGSKLEATIKGYAEARTKAMADGSIDAAEQAALDGYIGKIKEEQQSIADQWRALAPTLPGYGRSANTSGATDTPGTAYSSYTNIPSTTVSVGMQQQFDRFGQHVAQFGQYTTRLIEEGILIRTGGGMPGVGSDRLAFELTGVR